MAPYQANTGSRSLILNILIHVLYMQVNYGILYVNCNLHMAESKKNKKTKQKQKNM